ncbi:MAG: stalk domain-containing protein [Acetivibrionales bacterium]|jgi:hypothetical protein
MKRVNAFVMLIIFVITALLPFGVACADTRPLAKDVPNQTLVIGTFLIHLSALDSETVSLAEKSAENSGQKKVYYKSEFAKGEWVDITGTGTVDEILTEKGKIVSNLEIDSIPLTHWAKKPGEIIDLSTGKAVDARQINEPENNLPEGMKFLEKELESITNERKSQEKKLNKSSDSSERKEIREKLGIIDPILASVKGQKGYSDSESILTRIQSYKDYINRTHTDKRELYIAEVLELENNILTEQKIFVVQLIADRVKSAIDKASNKAHTDILEPLSNSSAALIDTQNNLINSLAGQSTDVLGEEKGILQKSLLGKIDTQDFSGADAVLSDILHINNIKNSIIKSSGEELIVLNRVLDRALDRLKSTAFVSNNSEFKAAKAAGESKAVLDKIIEDNSKQLESRVKDVEFIKTETIKRLEDNKSKISALERIKGYIAAIIVDLNAGSQEDINNNQPALKVLGDFLNLLDNEIKSIKASMNEQLSSSSKAKAGLENQLAALKEEYMSAVETGNIAHASSLKEQIGRVLEDLSNNNDNILDDLNKLDAEKRQLQNSLDKAVMEGNSSLAKELENEIGLKDIMISGLLDLLSDKDKNLINDFKERAYRVLDEINTPGSDIIGKLEFSVKDLLDTYNSLDEEYKSFVNSDGVIDKISDALQALYKTFSENGDSDSAAGILKQIGSVSLAAESMKMSMEERQNASILQLLIEYSPGSSKMEDYVSKHYSALNNADEARGMQSIYRNSFLSTGSTDKAGVQALIRSFRAAADALLVAEKSDYFSRMKLAIEGMNQGVDIETETLESFIYQNLLQLVQKESSIYTEEEIKSLNQKAEMITESYKYSTFKAGEAIFTDSNIKFLNPIIMAQGTPYIPIRDAFTGLGGSVVWVGTERKAVINYNGMEVKIIPHTREIFINGNKKDVEQDILGINGHIYIPAFLFEDITGYGYEYYTKYNKLIFNNRED